MQENQHLRGSSLTLGNMRIMACSGVSARSSPSTWCWLKVAIRTCVDIRNFT
jgi:hypothetical protein